jgi:2-polyprenyl-6-methoxyphenol hydroxylase-like FAD-dependent oxidoreductase
MRPITIVGGGLAGLALGIGLRQDGVPVTVREAGRYPRHKVCGEFLSGCGCAVLDQLRLREALLAAGARWAVSVRFVRGADATPIQPLPQPALCLSRWKLDELLAREFRRLGGELHEHQRGPAGELTEGSVRATGRRVEATEGGWRWFGLKAHAFGVQLPADLELHLNGSGYVGLCRLCDGVVNVCGLFWRREPEPALRQRWRECLRGPEGSVLAHQMRNARFDENTFCSVAGLSLAPHRADGRAELCIGDALTSIPPLTGNGMSMALESAAFARRGLTGYARGKLSWEESRRQIAFACDRAFSRRLHWAGFVQRLLTEPFPQRLAVAGILHWPQTWRWLFACTR